MDKGTAEICGYKRRLRCKCGAAAVIETEKLTRSGGGWAISRKDGWRCQNCRRRADEEVLAAKIYARLYPKKRGFAAMSPEKQRAIAASGGRKVQANGTAHRWSSEEAKIAGKKGGLKSPAVIQE